MNAVLRRYLRQYQGFVVFGLILLVCVGASIYGLFPAGKRVFGLVKEREASHKSVTSGEPGRKYASDTTVDANIRCAHRQGNSLGFFYC